MDDFYAARSGLIPPLPWSTFSPPFSYGVYGFAALSAPTFGQALRLFSDYMRAVDVPIGVTVSSDDKSLVFTIVPELLPRQFAGLYRFVVDFQMGQMLTACRDLAGPDFTFSALSVSYDQSLVGQRHMDLGDCKVTFGAGETSVTISASYLDRKVKQRNAATHALMTRLCDNMLRDLQASIGPDAAVRAILVANLGYWMSLVDVCARLGTSERSLRRKLAQKGTSYRVIADDVRMGFALKYLRDKGLDIDEIARALGFSDPTSFRRALRRWKGAAVGRNTGEKDPSSPMV